MGKKSIPTLIVFICLALSPALWGASSTTGQDSDNELVIGNNNVSGVVTGPPCKPPSGGYTLCRWDNIQVDYVQSRLMRWQTTYMANLIIKGKSKEINLNYQVTNPVVANAIASCERMASSSLAGLGLLSFYVNILTSAGSEIEAGFNGNKVAFHLDASTPQYTDMGCFLTGN